MTREIGAAATTMYSLTNASNKIPVSKVAYMQRQRYWIESAFQEAKNEAGMDEYQARSWQAWYRHMTLVMMALLFLLKERRLQSEALPLLSASDVKLLLARLLPQGDLDLEESIRQMHARHCQRQAATDASDRRRRRLQAHSSGNLTK